MAEYSYSTRSWLFVKILGCSTRIRDFLDFRSGNSKMIKKRKKRKKRKNLKRKRSESMNQEHDREHQRKIMKLQKFKKKKMKSGRERGEINIKTGEFTKKNKNVKRDREIKLKAGLTVFTKLEKKDEDLGVEFVTMSTVKSNHENVIFEEIIEKDEIRKIKFENEQKQKKEEYNKRNEVIFEGTKVSVLIARDKNARVVDEEYANIEVKKDVVIFPKIEKVEEK